MQGYVSKTVAVGTAVNVLANISPKGGGHVSVAVIQCVPPADPATSSTPATAPPQRTATRSRRAGSPSRSAAPAGDEAVGDRRRRRP
ncbi:MAG: hypothetical protein R2695_04200 [Acidimicrobiales bacterium]